MHSTLQATWTLSSISDAHHTDAAGVELPAMDAQEATEKLRAVLKVLTAFRSTFLTAQSRSQGVWKLHSSAPFDRLDLFLARCEEVLDMKLAVLQFGRLERIEVGGTEASILAPLPQSLFAKTKLTTSVSLLPAGT